MPVISLGGMLSAFAGADKTRQKAEADTLRGLYDADYRRYLRDRTAYQADVARQQSQALTSAGDVFDGQLAGALRASAGKSAGQIAALAKQQGWLNKAAQANDPNRAAFLANLGGRRVDPRYQVQDGTRLGVYDGTLSTTEVGRAGIAQKMAEAAKARQTAGAQQALAGLYRKKAENTGNPGGGKPVSLSAALVSLVQDSLPTLADQVYKSRFEGEDAPDAAVSWARNRALGLAQQGVPIDQAISRAVDEAATYSVFNRGWFNDTVDFTPPGIAGVQTPASEPASPVAQPPVPDARQAPDGKWYVQRDGRWYEVRR